MTLFPSSRGPSRRAAPADWLWAGLGLSMASASACFATYMIATAPAEVTGSGSKDWNIFVNRDRRGPALAGDGRRSTVRSASAARPDAALDREPTGSITTGSARTEVLHDFILRDVVGDKALVEHRDKLSLVKAGSVLEDAGQVLAIERRGDEWVVKTAAGIIGSGS